MRKRIFLFFCVLLLSGAFAALQLASAQVDTVEEGDEGEVLDLSFFATPLVISKGEVVRLDWSSSDASYCEASGSWKGRKEANGTMKVVPKKKSIYTLECFDEQGNASEQISRTIEVVKKKIKRQSPPATVTLRTNSKKVLSGEPFRLTWTSKNAVACQAGGPQEWAGLKLASGKETLVADEVSSTSKTEYSIECWNRDGLFGREAVATITVVPEGDTSIAPPPPPPPLTGGDLKPGYKDTKPVVTGSDIIVEFGRSATTITKPGEQIQLNWNTYGATSCVASGDWSGSKTTNGYEYVSPTVASTYILECKNSARSKSAIVTIPLADELKEKPLALVELDFSPPATVLAKGKSVTLSWKAKNATSCIASDAWSGIKPLEGAESIAPATSGKYSLECKNESNSFKKTVSIDVVSSADTTKPGYKEKPKEKFQILSVRLDPIDSLGNKTEDKRAVYVSLTHPWEKLTIDVYEMPSRVLHGTESFSYTGLSGMLVHTKAAENLKPQTTYRYTVTATKRGDASMTAYEDGTFITSNFGLEAAKKDFTLSASPSTPVNEGDTVELKWNAPGAMRCFYLGQDENNPNRMSRLRTQSGIDTVEIVASKTAMYYMLCEYSAGDVIKSVTITVNELARPKIVSFTANPSEITSGKSSVLTWQVKGATDCNLDIWNKTGEEYIGNLPAEGSKEVRPENTARYLLTCYGSNGLAESAWANVNVGWVDLPTGGVAINFQYSYPTRSSSNSQADVFGLVAGETATLTWNAPHAKSCIASEGWSGEKPLGGNEQVKPTQTTAYTLTCDGDEESVQKGVLSEKKRIVIEVTPKDSIGKYEYSLRASTLHIKSGQTVTIKGKYTDDTIRTCRIDGGGFENYTGFVDKSIIESDGHKYATIESSLAKTTTYSMTCTASDGTVLSPLQMTVLVDDASVSAVSKVLASNLNATRRVARQF